MATRTVRRACRRLEAARSDERRALLPALPALILLLCFFLLPGRAHAGLQRRGRHARLVRQGAGRAGSICRCFWNTFEIALLVTALCLLLGYPLGFLLATTTPVWATLGFIFVLLPLWTSVLVRTYAWMVLLGRNGVFNRC